MYIYVYIGLSLFGQEYSDKADVIVGSLYSLATSGDTWQVHFQHDILDMVFYYHIYVKLY